MVHYGKSSISIFEESFASIEKQFFFGGEGGEWGWTLRYNSMKFRDFPDIS